MRSGALALLAIGCALILGGITFGPIARAADDAPVEREELIFLLRGVRLTDGALQGFPDPPVQTSSLPSDLITQPAFRDIYLRISRTPQSQRNPDWLANAALLEMVKGDLDSAIDFLERAASYQPENAAPFWSDLAAVYLERARARQQPNDIFLALSASEKACKAGSWEARFNRALALERLHLDSAALWEWKRLLTEAPTPDWRQEVEAHGWRFRVSSTPIFEPTDLLARFHRKDFRSFQDLLAQHPQEVRSYGEEILLPQWVQFHQRDPGQAEAILGLLEAIGKGFEEAYGDRMLVETVQAIRSAERERVGETLRLLVEGHGKYAVGLQAFAKVDCTSAQAEFGNSAKSLRAGGSPFAYWADFYRGICFYFAQDFAAAESLIGEYSEADMQAYPVFEARVRWLKGLLQLTQSDPVASLQAYLRSLDLFQRAGEAGNVAALSSLVAENLLHLGQKELAWKYRERALSVLRQNGSTRIQTILAEAADAALREGEYEIALYFQDEVVKVKEHNGGAHAIAEAYLRRIPIQVRLGAYAQAEADYRLTLSAARLIPDSSLKERIEADALIAISEARLVRSPLKALAGLDQAVRLYESLGYRYRLVDLRRMRALVYEELGRVSMAEADLYAGYQEVEEEREKLEDNFRETYLYQSEALLEDMIRIIAQGDKEMARSFWYAEKMRLLSLPFPSRGLLDEEGHWEYWLRGILPLIPEDTLVLEFKLLDKKTLVWALRREKAEFFVIDVRKGSLDVLIERMTSQGASPKSFKRASSILFEHLIRPALRRPCRRLIVIPDKSLWGVPFAALYNAQTGRYLVEELSVVVAPSAVLLIAASSRARRLDSSNDSSILAVGDPAFDRWAFSMLPRLPGAKAEAVAAASLYSSIKRELLLDEGATVEAFVQSAPSHEILHFSGHAVDAEGSPLLLFAPSTSRPSGSLTMREISRLDLSRTRLVVLSGCRTARPPQSVRLASLSMAFLAAGASEVVGSLWKVEDGVADVFFREFHRYVASGVSGEDALRRLQLQWIQEANTKSYPYSWGSFQLTVGQLPTS